MKYVKFLFTFLTLSSLMALTACASVADTAEFKPAADPRAVACLMEDYADAE